MMKKTICMILAALMLFAAAACKSGENTETASSVSTTEASGTRSHADSGSSTGSVTGTSGETSLTTETALPTEQTSPSTVQPTGSTEETPIETPTETTAGTTEETPTPPPAYIFEGKLYERRKFPTGALPSIEGRYFGGFVDRVDLPEDQTPDVIELIVLDRKVSFEEQYELYSYEDAASGAGVLIGKGYSDGPRYMIGMRNILETDTQGKTRKITLNVDFFTGSKYERMDREEAETELAVLARLFVSTVFGVSLDGLETEFTTAFLSDSSIERNGFQYKGLDEPARYTIRFAKRAGRYLCDCGVQITYSVGVMPLPSLTAEYYDGIDVSADLGLLEHLALADLYRMMREDLPNVLAEGNEAREVYFRDETLRITMHDGKVAAEVDAVINLSDGTQVETGLCYVFDRIEENKEAG